MLLNRCVARLYSPVVNIQFGTPSAEAVTMGWFLVSFELQPCALHKPRRNCNSGGGSRLSYLHAQSIALVRAKVTWIVRQWGVGCIAALAEEESGRRSALMSHAIFVASVPCDACVTYVTINALRRSALAATNVHSYWVSIMRCQSPFRVRLTSEYRGTMDGTSPQSFQVILYVSLAIPQSPYTRLVIANLAPRSG